MSGKIKSFRDEFIIEDERGRTISASSEGLKTKPAYEKKRFYMGPNSAPLRVKHQSFGSFPSAGVDTWCSIIHLDQHMSMRVNGTLSAVKVVPGQSNQFDNGLDLAQGLGATADYVEYCWAWYPEKVSLHGAYQPWIYKVGSETENLRFKFTGRAQDISFATERVLFGFRKGQAAPTDETSFTDVAAVHVEAFGDLKFYSRINTGTVTNSAIGTDVSTENDWEFDVLLKNDGTLEVSVDGSDRSSFAAVSGHTFDTGDEVFPFLFFQNASGGNGDFLMREIELEWEEV
jgi:hypothetical protein